MDLAVRLWTSLKSIETVAPFDMVFIDADKEAYLEYLDWAEKNLKTGGLLVADNTFYLELFMENPSDSSTKTIELMNEFNKRLSDTPYWKGALIPTAEGLTVGIKQ